MERYFWCVSQTVTLCWSFSSALAPLFVCFDYVDYPHSGVKLWFENEEGGWEPQGSSAFMSTPESTFRNTFVFLIVLIPALICHVYRFCYLTFPRVVCCRSVFPFVLTSWHFSVWSLDIFRFTHQKDLQSFSLFDPLNYSSHDKSKTIPNQKISPAIYLQSADS